MNCFCCLKVDQTLLSKDFDFCKLNTIPKFIPRYSGSRVLEIPTTVGQLDFPLYASPQSLKILAKRTLIGCFSSTYATILTSCVLSSTIVLRLKSKISPRIGVFHILTITACNSCEVAREAGEPEEAITASVSSEPACQGPGIVPEVGAQLVVGPESSVLQAALSQLAR
jgi:hypothetical protein